MAAVMPDLNYKLSLKGLRDTLELAVVVGKNSDMHIDKPLFISRLTNMIDAIDEHLYLEGCDVEKNKEALGGG